MRLDSDGMPLHDSSSVSDTSRPPSCPITLTFYPFPPTHFVSSFPSHRFVDFLEAIVRLASMMALPTGEGSYSYLLLFATYILSLAYWLFERDGAADR